MAKKPPPSHLQAHQCLLEEFWLDTTDVKHFEMLGNARRMKFSRLHDFLVELLAFKGEEEVVSLEFEASLKGKCVLGAGGSFCGLQRVTRLQSAAPGCAVFGSIFVGFGILCSSSTPALSTVRP